LQLGSKNIILIIGLIWSWSLFAQAPEISCVPTGVTNPTIQWIEPTGICPQYTLYVSINGGPYNASTTFPQGTSTDYQYLNGDGSNNQLSFYFACDNNPTVTSDTVTNERMLNPVIQSVTMTNNTTVNITWDQGVSPSTGFYRVYESINGSALATQRGTDIAGIGTTSMSYTYPSNITTPLTYTVTALDNCKGNEDLPTAPTGYHSSVFMSLETDRCASALDISWTQYIGWDDIEHYLIRSTDLSNGALSVDTVHKDSSSFLLTDMIDANSVTTYIEAVSSNGNISRSNDTSVLINVVALPRYTYLANTSVHANGVAIKYYTDNQADIKSFEVHRRQINGQFTKIWSERVALPNGVNPADLNARLSVPMSYLDNNAIYDKLGYQYKVMAVDSCDQLHESNIGTSMFLEGNADYEYVNELKWPHYNTWDNGINSYQVLKQIDSSDNWIVAESLLDSFYDHDIEEETRDPLTRDYDGVFCYKIKAKTTPTNRDVLYGIDSIESMSNTLCLVQWPPYLSGVPNAFTPLAASEYGGNPCDTSGMYLNDCFGPNMVFMQKEDYLLAIFDRTGQLLFQTKDPAVKWDGRYYPQNGPPKQDMPMGAYVYVLRFRLPNPDDPSTHTDKVLKGMFMLIR
jgi:hypothetical protein